MASEDDVVHASDGKMRMKRVRALMFDVHGLTVPCTHATAKFDPARLDMVVHARVRSLVRWAVDAGLHVAFVSYGKHEQLDPLLRAGLGDDLFDRVVVVTPSDSGRSWSEGYTPPSDSDGKHTLCLRAAELLAERGAPELGLAEMMLFEDSPSNAAQFLRNGGAHAMLFTGGVCGRSFGGLLESLTGSSGEDANPLATLWNSAELSLNGYMVLDYDDGRSVF